MNDAAVFASLFVGNSRSHGKWNPATGAMRTDRVAATATEYAAHLNGKEGLGAVPILDDGTIKFAAIDIDNHGDDKDIDLLPMVKVAAALSLPLLLCRSKSGGIHCYLFGSEPLNARSVRTLLTDWAGKIGYPSAEIDLKSVV